MAKPAQTIAVEVPGASVATPDVEVQQVATAEPLVPTEAELAIIAAMRSGKTLEQATAPAPAHRPVVELKEASDYDQSKLKTAVLTKQGWLLPDAAQKQANG